MKRKNTTRNALYTSVISLLLCVSMLVGATFAWFTDEVKSGNNLIAAGNLDIELDYYDTNEKEWKTVDKATDLFSDELWEPGHTQVVYLKMSNVGTLNLKYQLGINVASEIPGTNKAGNPFKLSDVLEFAVINGVNGETGPYADRIAARKAATSSTKLSAGYYVDYTAMAPGAAEYMAMVVYMPESTGNEANYMTGTDRPEINLGINLFATQVEAEKDSFGPDYDATAPAIVRLNGVAYSTFAEALAVARAANGGTIEISGYVEFTPVAQNEGSHHGDEDFTGITVKGIDDSAVFAIVGAGVPDIVNGTFENLIFVDEGTYNPTAAEFMYQNFANTTFTGVTFVDGVRIGNSYVGTSNTQTTFTNCVFNASTNQEYALFIDNGGVKIDGCTFNATSAAYGVIKVYDTRYALQPSNVAITNTKFNNETNKQDINSAYHEDIDITIDGVPYYNVENTDQLAAALNNTDAKKIINLDSSMKMVSSSTSSEVIITAAPGAVLDLTWGAYLEKAKLTFNGVTIKGSTGYVTTNGTNFGSDYAALYSHDVTYNDCTFDGPFRIGRDGAAFNNCTFTNLGNDYVWTYGNVASFDGCTFNSDGKALLIYSDGNGTVPAVSVTNCIFNATKEAFAGAVPGMPCAAIEIDNYGCGVDLTTSGNTIGENFSAEWRIKSYDANKEAVIVNGVTYTGQTVGGNAFVVVGTTDELSAALTAGATNICLKNGEFTANLYDISARDSLTIIGNGADTKLKFSNLQVRASQFKELTISNCTIERMPNKSWGHLVFGSSTTADGIYTISNCVFNGVGSQGIYINQTVPATFNIENCTFNGDFGGEGAITVQNNDGVNVTVNVTGCAFNNIPTTSHEIYVLYAYDGWTLNAEGVDAYWKAKQ